MNSTANQFEAIQLSLDKEERSLAKNIAHLSAIKYVLLINRKDEIQRELLKLETRKFEFRQQYPAAVPSKALDELEEINRKYKDLFLEQRDIPMQLSDLAIDAGNEALKRYIETIVNLTPSELETEKATKLAAINTQQPNIERLRIELSAVTEEIAKQAKEQRLAEKYPIEVAQIEQLEGQLKVLFENRNRLQSELNISTADYARAMGGVKFGTSSVDNLTIITGRRDNAQLALSEVESDILRTEASLASVKDQIGRRVPVDFLRELAAKIAAKGIEFEAARNEAARSLEINLRAMKGIEAEFVELRAEFAKNFDPLIINLVLDEAEAENLKRTIRDRNVVGAYPIKGLKADIVFPQLNLSEHEYLNVRSCVPYPAWHSPLSQLPVGAGDNPPLLTRTIVHIYKERVV